jgi:hypothetical protein
MRMGIGEVGGWAVAESHRRTMEPVGIPLATYGLLELLGGCVGVAMATFRHASFTILRKIGLSSLAADGMELTSYFDRSHGCEMEVLRFDSRVPSSKYAGWVTELASILMEAPVICPGSVASSRRGVWNQLQGPAGYRSVEPGGPFSEWPTLRPLRPHDNVTGLRSRAKRLPRRPKMFRQLFPRPVASRGT